MDPNNPGVLIWANLPVSATSPWSTGNGTIYTTSKKVGIGINNPTSIFHIETSSNGRAFQSITTADLSLSGQQKIGVYGQASGSGSSDNNGGWFDASGSGTGENIGVGGQAMGSSSLRNIGVYGTASGNASGNNWAGYFDGKVHVENDLILGNSGNIYMFSGGTSNSDKMIMGHSSGQYSNWGLQYKDNGDQFIFLADGNEKVKISLSGSPVLKVTGQSEITGNLTIGGELNTSDGGSSNMAPVFYMQDNAHAHSASDQLTHDFKYSNSNFIDQNQAIDYNTVSKKWVIKFNSSEFNLTDECVIQVSAKAYKLTCSGCISSYYPDEILTFFPNVAANELYIFTKNDNEVPFSLTIFKR
jgi:hypothetical protein